MGCCGSKADTTVQLTSVVDGNKENLITVGGGAAIGAVVAGPVGAAIGAAIGLAVAGGVGKVVKARPDLLKDLWRGLVIREELIHKLPKVGLLRLDRKGKPQPPAVTDALMAKDVNSTLFTVVSRTVKGLDVETVHAGKPLSAQQQSALADSIAELEKAGAVAITTDSGLFVHYQKATTGLTTLPVLLSPLLQAPLLMSVLSPHEVILTITSDAAAFGQADLEAALIKSGLAHSATAAKRFVLRGCQQIPGFTGDGPIDLIACERGLIDLVMAARVELEKAGRPLGAVLLESAMLPAFSDVLRAAFPLPIFDNFTLSDFAFKATSDNPRFGVEFGSGGNKSAPALDKAKMPAIGIMRIDYTYPPALGDAAHPNSYYYRTPHATVKGLTFESAQKGSALTAAQRDAMAAAVAKLEAEQGVMGIAGDCGFMMHYQKDARALCKVPCFISSLLQASMLVSLFDDDEQILVLTANGPALVPHMPALLVECGVTKPEQQRRFHVAGCEDLPGFEAVALGQKVDVDKVQPHVVRLVQAKRAELPKLRAVLLECTELPPYADAIRKETRLPVLDAITLVDFFHGAISENPYFGIDWQRLANTPAFA